MRTRSIYIVALVVTILDQLTKLLVTSRLPYGASVTMLGPIDVTLVRNPGGAFGLFQDWAAPLTIISLIVVVGIVVLSRRSGRLSLLVGIALALQLGGALGNLIDRLRLGYVVDFINLQVWPVFNLADIAITSGIALLAVHIIFCERSAPQTTGDVSLVESEPAKR